VTKPQNPKTPKPLRSACEIKDQIRALTVLRGGVCNFIEGFQSAGGR
jgi:hypothetical protein